MNPGKAKFYAEEAISLDDNEPEAYLAKAEAYMCASYETNFLEMEERNAVQGKRILFSNQFFKIL